MTNNQVQGSRAKPIIAEAWVRKTGRFLVDRLEEFERELLEDEVARQFHGHVMPALARFRDALDAQDIRPDPLGCPYVGTPKPCPNCDCQRAAVTLSPPTKPTIAQDLGE